MLMSRRALAWATAVWEQQSVICISLEEFLAESPFSRRDAAHKLHLHQDARSVADYTVEFCTLAAEIAWNPDTLFNMFLHRSSEVIKDELTALTSRSIGSYGNVGGRGNVFLVAFARPRFPPRLRGTPKAIPRDSDVTRVLTGIAEGGGLASSRAQATGKGSIVSG
jgi:hypothetical protein